MPDNNELTTVEPTAITITDERRVTLTVSGNRLITKGLLGKEIKFTKAVLGAGTLTDASNIKEMTAVIAPRMELPCVHQTLDGAGTARLDFQLTNTDLATGFRATEIGVFALDPDTHEEVLYCYRYTGDYSDFIPAGTTEPRTDIYTLLVAVDQAQNVTVVLTDPIGGVPLAMYYEHLDEANPHGLLGDEVGEADSVAVHLGNKKRFDWMTLDNLRKLLIGDNSNIPLINGRLSQAETAIAELGIKTLLAGDLDKSTLYFYDNLNPTKELDSLAIKVKAISAGSNTVGLATLEGIIPGSWYTITDGIKNELVQVQGVAKNGSVLRIDCKDDIVNTYNLDSCMIYRSTVSTEDGSATGSADVRAAAWDVETVWQGEAANTGGTVALNSSLGNSESFDTDGYAEFTADGYMTIMQGDALAVPTQSGTLSYTGSTQSPTWAGYDSEKMTISGTTSAVNAGAYEAKFTPTGGNSWVDGTTAAKTVVWTIDKAVIAGEPKQMVALTYNGANQSPTWGLWS